MFGADLRDVSMPTSGGSIPSDWLDYSSCVDVLHENGICPAHIDALEVYAGCGGWTKACHSCGLKVGPLIDNEYGKGRWDLLSAKWRRLLWAVMVVCQPTWIHSGFPCTFWVLMV